MMVDIMVGMSFMLAVLAILGALAALIGADSRPGVTDDHRSRRLADWW
jgi:hypothetical protein